MGKRNQEVTDYLAKYVPEKIERLETIRALIHETIPEINEKVWTRVPCFYTDKGSIVIRVFGDHINFITDAVIQYFTLGYYCHLITDNLWSKSVYYEYFQCDEGERNIRVEKCYCDYYTMNRVLIEEFNSRKVNLHIPEHITIEEITSGDLHIRTTLFSFWNNLNP